METSFLLLASLGPIQDFIASARKCQDLWFGSWMLSDLARATAEAFQRASPNDPEPLIFPGDLTPSPGESRSVANKILALFLRTSLSPKQIAEDGRQAMLRRLLSLGEEAYNQLRLQSPKYFHRDVAIDQLLDLMEYLWVAIPLQSAEDYPVARARAEELLARRKNTKVWGSVPWNVGVGVPKSSLDGLRESVIGERLYEDIQKLEDKGKEKGSPERQEAARLRSAFYLKGMERLCGIGLLKRIGSEPPPDPEDEPRRDDGEQADASPRPPLSPDSPTFHSTSHMAAAPLLTRLTRLALLEDAKAQSPLRAHVERLIAAGARRSRMRIDAGHLTHANISDLLCEDAFTPTPQTVPCPRTFFQEGQRGYDGTFVFESRVEEILEDSGVSASPEATAELREACIKALGKIGVSEPTPYYAFLLADGDRMGAALDKLAPSDPEAAGPGSAIQAHRDVSAALVAFNNQSREIVTLAGGSLIYAGGDDVLALLPLHTALQCAYQLKVSFLEKTEDCFKESVVGKDFKVPTLSVGLGIAHHMDAMGEARDLAKKAERLAKDNDRNSLGIVVSKRSGSSLQAVGRWSEDDPLHLRLSRWARLLHEEILPHGAAYKLEELLRVWELQDPQARLQEEDIVETITALAHRVIDRRRCPSGSRVLEETRQRMRDALEPSTDEAAKSGQSPKGDTIRERVLRLSTEIQIARLFLRARNDAFGELKTPLCGKTEEASEKTAASQQEVR